MEGHSDMNERRESLINVVIGGSGEEEIERSSIGDNIIGGASVDERCESSSKRKKPIRHNSDQIQALGSFFKKNSLPNKKVQLELATKLSMDINQSQLKLYENKTLKQENDKFRIEHIVMKEALENSIRYNCKEKIDENQRKIEHDQLEDEVKRLTAQAYKLSLFNKDVVHDKMVLLNLAMDALNELFRLYENDKPLWVSSLDGGGETLNIEEYARLFTPLIGTKPEHFTTEATKASGIVADTSLALVNTLMDKRQWVEMFPCIVGKTYTTDVISTGIGGNKSGSLLLIKTELQIISVLVSVREVQFLRFCKKHVEGVWAIVDVQWVEMFPCIVGKTYTTDVISTGIGGNKSGSLLLIKTELQIISDLVYVREVQFLRFCKKHAEGVWAIVDVSVDTIQEGSQQSEIENCRRLPSGCILQDMPNGYCQVTWIEHMEYNENLVHDWYRPVIKTVDLSGERGIRMLAQRMTHNFCAGGDDSGANRVILQDTCMDATGSLLVYATIDSQEINTVMKGGDSSCVTLFSNGITIVPDYFQDFSTTNNYNVISGEMNNGFGGGSLVTISFQMVGNIFPATTLSMELVKEANALISHTIHKIKSALKCK
ncbi:homeobox-leucine zipper protein ANTHOCYANINLESS 2-like [Solanum tuberosum]|uniref:homeobox-leucine zipper protein ANTHOCYANINLESS 2-like n=1 Tax=Solanum tuberosum TaxID=4113 RepID=UPI00073A2BA9|nr:PREDICTED: homeobox-leucine zipper protein ANTHOCYANINLESS 2-like [Solanum tuberosum]